MSNKPPTPPALPPFSLHRSRSDSPASSSTSKRRRNSDSVKYDSAFDEGRERAFTLIDNQTIKPLNFLQDLLDTGHVHAHPSIKNHAKEVTERLQTSAKQHKAMKKMKFESDTRGGRQSDRIQQQHTAPADQVPSSTRPKQVHQIVHPKIKLGACQALEVAFDLDEHATLIEDEEKSEPSDISTNYDKFKKRSNFARALEEQVSIVFDNPRWSKRNIQVWWNHYEEAKKHCSTNNLELASLDPAIIFPLGGRRAPLPKYMEISVVEKVKKKANTFAPCTVEGLIEELKMLYETKQLKRLPHKTAERYARKIMKLYNLVEVKGDTKSFRRIVTITSIRDMFGEIIQIILMHVYGVSVHLMLNIDSTGYALGRSLNHTVNILIPKGHKDRRCCEEMMSSNSTTMKASNPILKIVDLKNRGHYAFHMPYCINAAGATGALVIARTFSKSLYTGILKKNIDNGLIVVEVPQFCTPANSNIPGYVVFVPDDAEPDAYPKWYLETVYKPFLKKCYELVQSFQKG